MESAFNDLVTNLVQLNLASIGSQETVSNSNTLLTNANQELCHAWTSSTESDSNDPGYGAWYYLEKINNGGQAPSGPAPSASQLPPNFVTPTGMTGWVKMFLENSNYSLNHLSSTFMTFVYGVFEAHRPTSKENGSACLATISSVTNLLQATAQADEQTGQNGITLLNNIAQHFESNQGPLSSATSTILDGANNYSSALSQISA